MEQQRGAGMILQALCEYYERKVANDPQSIPPPGFEQKEIPFIFEVAPNPDRRYSGDHRQASSWKEFLGAPSSKKIGQYCRQPSVGQRRVRSRSTGFAEVG